MWQRILNSEFCIGLDTSARWNDQEHQGNSQKEQYTVVHQEGHQRCNEPQVRKKLALDRETREEEWRMLGPEIRMSCYISASSM
jgi:hypothetical protein